MSSLVKNGTIRIDSVGGERRYVEVSGGVRARLFWLFRNFWILDFPVLNKKQQELIAQLWQAGKSVGSAEAPEYLMGAIEGFLPQRYAQPEKQSDAQPNAQPSNQPISLPAQLPARPVAIAKLPAATVPNAKPAIARLLTAKPTRRRVRVRLPNGLRISAVWTATSILLLGCAMFLGASLRSVPRSREVAAAAPDYVAATKAEAARDAAPADGAASDKAVADANVVTLGETVATTNHGSSTGTVLARTSADLAPSVSDTPADTTEASSTPRFHPPDAMAYDASSREVNLSRPRIADQAVMAKGKAPGKPEVVISVSVDRDGRAQAFHVLRGDQKKISAALHAAKRWSFQPCSGAEDCEHLLKFTDYGDASIVQVID